MLAVGVVEMMPDQELFSVIHPGPPGPQARAANILHEAWLKRWLICKGLLCKHLSRSSPVFAILAAIADGSVGWVCYFPGDCPVPRSSAWSRRATRRSTCCLSSTGRSPGVGGN